LLLEKRQLAESIERVVAKNRNKGPSKYLVQFDRNNLPQPILISLKELKELDSLRDEMQDVQRSLVP